MSQEQTLGRTAQAQAEEVDMQPTRQPEQGQEVEVDEEAAKVEFENNRNENNQRLKSRFEHIFEKYGRDFSGIGDEIDIETGEIVVDNGHLENMEHEADPGEGECLRFAKDFTALLEHEDESGDGSGSEEGSEEGECEGEDVDMEDEVSGETSTESGPERGSVSRASPTDPEDLLIDPLLLQLSAAASEKPPTSREQTASARATPDVSGRPSSVESETRSAASFDVMNMPAVKESMKALQTAKSGANVDPDAIQALGLSIANQISQFLGNSKSKSKAKTKSKRNSAADPTWDFPDLPAFKKQRTEAARARPRLKQLSDWVSPDAKQSKRKEPRESLWAPQHHPYHPRKKRRREPEPDADQNGQDVAQNDTSAANMQPATEQAKDGSITLKKCYHCNISATTAWRKGPDGDLCNGCGMYLYRYGLMKPPRPTTPEYESDPEPGASDDEEYKDPSHYSANTSRRMKAPAVPRSKPFTLEEDALCIKLKEIDHISWEQIGRHYPDRSHYAVQCRYSKKLRGDCEGRKALIEQGFTFEVTQVDPTRVFNDEQDELLVQLREESELGWAGIAERLPGKTAETIEERYNILLGNYPAQAQKKKKKRPNPKYDKVNQPRNHTRSYSAEEDELLIKLREIDRLPWELLAQEFSSRTWLSLQKRYVRTLAQRQAIMREGGDDPYAHLFVTTEEDEVMEGESRLDAFLRRRKEEDELLLKYKDEDGLEFQVIVEEHMKHRSLHYVTNRYHYLKLKNDSMDVPAPTSPDNAPPADANAGNDDSSAAAHAMALNEGIDYDEEFADRLPEHIVRRGGNYMPSEDKLILKLRDEDGLDFVEIAKQLHGRKPPTVEKRYYHLIGEEHQSTFSPKQRKETEKVTASASAIDPQLLDDPAASDGSPAPLPAMDDGSAQVNDGSGSPTDGGSVISHDPDQHMPPPPRPPSSCKTAVERAADDAYEAALHNGDVAGGKKRARNIVKYTQEEHDLLVALRDQGLGWTELARHFPGRTAGSLSSYWASYIRHGGVQNARHVNHPNLAPPRFDPSRPYKSLLQQAVDNRSRGKNEITPMLEILNMQPGHPGPMNLFNTLCGSPAAPRRRGEPEEEEFEFDFAKLGGGPLSASPQKPLQSPAQMSPSLPGAVPGESVSPEASRHAAAGSSPLSMGAETPSKAPAAASSPVEMTPPVGEEVRNSIEMEPNEDSMDIDLPPETPVRGTLARPAPIMADTPARAAAGYPPVTPGPAPISYFGAATPLPAATPYTAALPFPAATPSRAGTPFRASTPMPASTPFSAAPAPAIYNTPARYGAQGMPYYVPEASMHASAPIQPSPSVQQAQSPASPMNERIVQYELERPVSEEPIVSQLTAVPPPKAKAAVAPKKRTETPKLDSREASDGEEAYRGSRRRTKRTSTRNQPSSPASPAATLRGGPPPFSWNELITMAIKSSPLQRLDIRDIYSYLEDQFPYFKAAGEAWKVTMRKHLSGSNEFEKVSDLAATWTFRQPDAVSPPKKKAPRPPKRAEKRDDHATLDNSTEHDITGASAEGSGSIKPSKSERAASASLPLQPMDVNRAPSPMLPVKTAAQDKATPPAAPAKASHSRPASGDVQKKPRGRPRKNPLPPKTVVEPTYAPVTTESTPARTAPQQLPSTSSDGMPVNADGHQQASSSAWTPINLKAQAKISPLAQPPRSTPASRDAPKKGRGRPRKHPAPQNTIGDAPSAPMTKKASRSSTLPTIDLTLSNDDEKPADVVRPVFTAPTPKTSSYGFVPLTSTDPLAAFRSGELSQPSPARPTVLSSDVNREPESTPAGLTKYDVPRSLFSDSGPMSSMFSGPYTSSPVFGPRLQAAHAVLYGKSIMPPPSSMGGFRPLVPGQPAASKPVHPSSDPLSRPSVVAKQERSGRSSMLGVHGSRSGSTSRASSVKPAEKLVLVVEDSEDELAL